MTPLGLQSAAYVCSDSDCLLGCLYTCSNHVGAGDNPPSFTGKRIESPGAPTPGLRPPGQTEMVLGTQDTKRADHSPTATLPCVFGFHQ